MSDKKKPVKYRLELNEHQMHVVRDALENYFRMGMGQLDVSVEEFLRMHFWDLVKREAISNTDDRHDPTWTPVMKAVHELTKEKVNQIKMLVFDHAPGASYGIFNEKVPAVCREAYDICQVVRKALSDVRIKRHPEDKQQELFTVDQRPYMASNPDQPPALVEIIDE
tara:strand:- start:1220 stop:1720 length:501 start_codon:yes stop_codon:yes gene_type:complete